MEDIQGLRNQDVSGRLLGATSSDDINKFFPDTISDDDYNNYIKYMTIVKNFVLQGGDIDALNMALNGLKNLLPHLMRSQYETVTTILSEFSKSQSPDGTYKVISNVVPDFKNLNWGDEKISWTQVMTDLDVSGADNPDNKTTAQLIMDLMKTYYDTVYQDKLDQTGVMIDSCTGGNTLATALMQLINMVTTVNKSDFKVPPASIDDIPNYILDEIRTSPDSPFNPSTGTDKITWQFDDKTGRYVPFSTEDTDKVLKYYSTLGQGVNQYVGWFNDYFKEGPAFSAPDFSTTQIESFLLLRNAMVKIDLDLKNLGQDNSSGTVREAVETLINKFNVFGSITDIPTDAMILDPLKWVEKSNSNVTWEEAEISYVDENNVTHTVSVNEGDLNQGMKNWLINSHGDSTDIDNLVTAISSLKTSASSQITAANAQLEYVVDLVKKIAEALQSIVTDTARSVRS